MPEDLFEQFDALALVGVLFTYHVSAKGIEEVLQMIKKGGYLTLNYREDQDTESSYFNKL